MTKNLQIAIDKALAALEPSILQRYERRPIDVYKVEPAYIGPLQRRTVEMLVDAALKYQEALEKRQAECAYTVPCLQCIHQACGSYKDNVILEAETVP